MKIALQLLQFRKSTTRHISTSDLTSYLAVTHISNDVNFLGKQAQAWMRPSAVPTVESAIGMSGTACNIRLLAGRLHEAHLLVNSKPLSETIRQLDKPFQRRTSDFDESLQRLSECRRAFTRRCNSDQTLATLRNKSAFHIGHADFGEALGDVDENIELAEYLGDIHGNTFFAAAELVALARMTHHLNGELVVALTSVRDHVLNVAADYQRFAVAFASAFAQRYMYKYLTQIYSEKNTIEVEAGPVVNMNYFVDISTMQLA